MRGCLSILMLLPACAALCQTPQAPAIQANTVRPDAVIYVKHHPLGADLVQITMVNPSYPEDTLKKQSEDLCRRLNFPAQGLSVYSYTMGDKANLKFVQASFATAGLSDADGNANLTPILQSFAGVPAPYTVKGIEIFYSDFDPPIKGPKSFKSNAVVVSGREDANPPQVEYSVQLLSQNPSDLLVETKPPTVEPTVKQAPVEKSTPVVLWCLILLAGMAAGALVYFLLIKRLSGGSATSS